MSGYMVEILDKVKSGEMQLDSPEQAAMMLAERMGVSEADMDELIGCYEDEVTFLSSARSFPTEEGANYLTCYYWYVYPSSVVYLLSSYFLTSSLLSLLKTLFILSNKPILTSYKLYIQL